MKLTPRFKLGDAVVTSRGTGIVTDILEDTHVDQIWYTLRIEVPSPLEVIILERPGLTVDEIVRVRFVLNR